MRLISLIVPFLILFSVCWKLDGQNLDSFLMVSKSQSNNVFTRRTGYTWIPEGSTACSLSSWQHIMPCWQPSDKVFEKPGSTGCSWGTQRATACTVYWYLSCQKLCTSQRLCTSSKLSKALLKSKRSQHEFTLEWWDILCQEFGDLLWRLTPVSRWQRLTEPE